jgi:hypothetical protein
MQSGALQAQAERAKWLVPSQRRSTVECYWNPSGRVSIVRKFETVYILQVYRERQELEPSPSLPIWRQSMVCAWQVGYHVAKSWLGHRVRLPMPKTNQSAICLWVRPITEGEGKEILTWQSLYAWWSILYAVPHQMLLCNGIFRPPSPHRIWLL